MKKEIDSNLHAYPLHKLQEIYCYLSGNYSYENYDKEALINHIWHFIHLWCRFHRNKKTKEINIDYVIKFHILLSWYYYTHEKYGVYTHTKIDLSTIKTC